MNNLFDLLKVLYCIKFFAKDIHYTAKGDSFYSDHLLADRIIDGLDDFIDDINENLYLVFEEKAPISKQIIASVTKDLMLVQDDTKVNWRRLYSYLEEAEELIYKIEEEYKFPQISSLLDNIANDLQKKKGLIWRRMV